MLHEFFTTICDKCDRPFYVAAGDDTCPHCYHSRKQQRSFKRVIIVIGALLITYLVVTL